MNPLIGRTETGMTTFDLADVQAFYQGLDARFTRCDNGEGMHCANLNDTLLEYAILCCEFRNGIRQWGRAVFTGRAKFDPEVEKFWKDKAAKLFWRAFELLSYGERQEGPCYTLEGKAALQSALWELSNLLNNWVTPSLAVGPSARHKVVMSPEEAADIRRRIEALPPLPSDWQPTDAQQRDLLRKMRQQQTS
jgi:hypothetical protein